MKVRAGYVSNSSSSSFCIVGIAVHECEFREMFGNAPEDGDDDFYGFLEENFRGMDFHRGIDEYSDECWIIGRHIDSMKDDQTLGDFKREIFDHLKANGYAGEPSSVRIHVDGGYDG